MFQKVKCSYKSLTYFRITNFKMMHISLIIEHSVLPQLQTSSTFVSFFLHHSSPQHGDDGYVIGTSHGRLEGKYKRTSLAACHAQFLKPEEVPGDVISLREAARMVSGGSSQGIKKCTCRKTCTKRCSCVKSCMKCGRRCKSVSCNNM